MKSTRLNLAGKRFGRLVVLRLDRKGKHRYWLCECDCGNIKPVMHENLANGRTRSCGCLNSELSKVRGLKHVGKNNPNWKGGIKKTKPGYIQIYKPDHPYSDKNGYIQEHRLIIEKVLGRFMKPHECAHHIDKNRKNNKNKNLVACNDWGYHQILHHRERLLKNNPKMEVINHE